MALVRREPRRELPELFDWMWRDPFRMPFAERFRAMFPEVGSAMRLEEFTEGDTFVVRAELPGIDPDKDVEITISESMLTIKAERREERKEEEEGGRRFHSEFSYGSYTRTVPLPSGATEDDVKAEYKDGILTVRVPIAAEEKAEVKRIAISKAGG